MLQLETRSSSADLGFWECCKTCIFSEIKHFSICKILQTIELSSRLSSRLENKKMPKTVYHLRNFKCSPTDRDKISNIFYV